MMRLRRNASAWDRRYELLPQMRSYDSIRINWTPYVMFTNQLNVHSEVFNTDSHGFRRTWHDGKWFDYEAFQRHSGPKGIICGGSTAFGVGATSDENTLPSLLNRESSTAWFNFGTRAANSTQELLNFIFHMPRVEKVVLYTGINNLVANWLSTHYALPFGGFIGDWKFHHLNQNGSYSLQSLIPGLRAIQRRVRGVLRRHDDSLEHPDLARRFDESLTIIERDLEVWRILRDTLGFSLSYVLQPFAGWTKNQLSAEEQELFRILDEIQGNHWRAMYRQITESYTIYVEHLLKMCSARRIDFVDANKLMPKDGWLFCDRAHLTDKGNATLAAALTNAMRLH